MRNTWPRALSAGTATSNQRASWLPVSTGRRQQGQDADDEGDPAPGVQVAEHVVRLGELARPRQASTRRV